MRNISNQSASYNAADQLESDGSTSYSYTDDGYLSQKIETNQSTNYIYDSLGRLKQVSRTGANPQTITYEHNALGNRVAKRVNGTITGKYLWLNKTILLATFDANNNLKQRFEYTLGNTPSSYTQNGNSYYIISDHLGSPRIITDANGSVLKEVEYDSFGNVISDTNPAIQIPFGFAGGLNDTDTGLIRFGFRDYDPTIGRWTALDPIGFAGGDTNLYGYVFSDPVNFVDPRGTDAISVSFIGYPIRVISGLSKIPLTHSGILLIDNETGYTKYYEYGRYDLTDPNIVGLASDDGNVRLLEVSNVVLGKDGEVTKDSLQKVLNQLLKLAGHGIEPVTTKHDGDFEAIQKSILEFANDPDRSGYGVGNNCVSFSARSAIGG